MRPKSQARVGTSNRLSAEAMAAAAPTRATTPGQRLRSTPLAVSPRSSASTAMIAAVSTSSGPKYRRLWVAPMRLARGDRLGQRRRGRFPDLIVQAQERRALQVQDGRRVDAEEEHDRGERHEREELPAVDLGEPEVLLVRLSEVHALERPEEVAGRQDDRARGDDGEAGELLPGAEEHEHLRDERRQARQPHRGEEGEPRDPRVDGDDRGEPAEAADLAMVGPVVDDAHEEEEHGGDRAVVEHLEDGAVD